MIKFTESDEFHIGLAASRLVSNHLQGLSPSEHDKTAQAMAEAIKQAVADFVRANR